MTTRLEYYRQLNDALKELCLKAVPQHPSHSDESNEELLSLFTQLDVSFSAGDDYALIGQYIITRIVSHYPDITPQLHRDLLWFFWRRLPALPRRRGNTKIPRFRRALL